MKKRICIFLALLMSLSCLVGCSAAVRQEQKPTKPFTDSCGRTVEVPEKIDHIVPSGALAQIVLYTVCPEKLQSWASALTRTQKKYIPERYWDLPVTGQYYGGSATFNLEEVLSSAPDVIVDVGERKDGIADDLDDLQARTGIPCVFIEASLDTLEDAYKLLGELTGSTEQADACADYIGNTLRDAAEKTAQIPDGERVRVLYAQGEYGTEVLGKGSIHAEVLDYAGAENVAVVPELNSRGSSDVSMEQIYLWNPDVLILSPDANYDEIFDDPMWQPVSAVQSGRVYEVPGEPYPWLDRPPSVQRVLGVKWLGNLLYPEIFDYDMLEETRQFYRLFYHCELTREEAQALLANSAFK